MCTYYSNNIAQLQSVVCVEKNRLGLHSPLHMSGTDIIWYDLFRTFMWLGFLIQFHALAITYCDTVYIEQLKIAK